MKKILTIAILVMVILGISQVTTYSSENGFNKEYHGQTYIDMNVKKICTNEDCSN